jgi:hypothetical protein
MKLDDIPREHLEAALAQLEAAKEQRKQERPPGPWFRIVLEPGETEEAAVARFRENPDTPKNARWIIRTIVAVGPDHPKHHQMMPGSAQNDREVTVDTRRDEALPAPPSPHHDCQSDRDDPDDHGHCVSPSAGGTL